MREFLRSLIRGFLMGYRGGRAGGTFAEVRQELEGKSDVNS